MNLRQGVDTHPTDFVLLAKLNIPSDDREAAVGVLQALEAVRAEKLDPSRIHGTERSADGSPGRPRSVVNDYGLNVLVGFGLRFFLGPLDRRRPEESIPNFPPGGTFAPRKPTRFGIQDRGVPLYLRTMNATGDKDWVATALTRANNGRTPSAEELNSAFDAWLSRAESDLLLVMECDNRFLMIDLWDAIRSRVAEGQGAVLHSLQEGLSRGDGRDHTGYFDGVSNLSQKIATDPAYYRTKVYLPHPAPAYPGEPDWSRDDHRYDGGTYLVQRKYIEHLDRWFSGDLEVKDAQGRVFKGEEARQHAIGRDRESGQVISRTSGRLLDKEPDSTEANLGYDESHVTKARGGITAPFMGPFPPLQPGQTNVFNTQDIRIRRRGANFSEIDYDTGKVTYGLHFLCFQNNIQQTGFEFINNIWLLNPMFRRSKDGLFNPETGVIEPVEGCYYFVPAEHRKYPGDIFFE
jgi:deferrochelatase/peroxidase EfeB